MKELISTTPFIQLDLIGRPDVFLKLECNQFANSFKIRGVVSYLEKNPIRKGLVTFTTGNHGIAVAAIAKRVGTKAFIFSSKDLSPYKKTLIENFGGIVQLLSYDDLDYASNYAQKYAKENALTYVPLYNNADLLKGYSEIMREIHNNFKKKASVFFPIGSGSLLLANAKTATEINSGNHVIGVEPRNCQRINLQHDKRNCTTSIADCLAINKIPICNLELFKYVCDVRPVDEEEIVSSMALMYALFGMITEPGGAITLSAALATCFSDEIKIAVITGKNISESRFMSLITQDRLQSGGLH